MFASLKPTAIETYEDSHGFKYTLLSTADNNRKRVNALWGCIDKWNKADTQRRMQFFLQANPDTDGIITFGKGDTMSGNCYYDKIEESRAKHAAGEPTKYSLWTSTDRGYIDTSKRGGKNKRVREPEADYHDAPAKMPRLDTEVDGSPADPQLESEAEPDDDDEESEVEIINDDASIAVTMAAESAADTQSKETINELLEQVQDAKRNAAEIETTLQQAINELTAQLQASQSRVLGLERTNANMKAAYQIKERNLRSEHALDKTSSQNIAAGLTNTIAFLRNHNESQRYIIGKLNADKDKLQLDHSKLHEKIDKLVNFLMGS